MLFICNGYVAGSSSGSTLEGQRVVERPQELQAASSSLSQWLGRMKERAKEGTVDWVKGWMEEQIFKSTGR